MNVEDLLKGIPDPTNLFERIAHIVGGTLNGTTLNVNLQFKRETAQEIRESRARIREMELQLRQLRSEVVNAKQRFNSNCTVLKAELSKLSASHVAALRQGQLEIQHAYDVVKNAADNVLVQLANMKDSLG